MAIVSKTMEEIRAEVTSKDIEKMWEALKNHVDEYDPECPPLTDEELREFRPYKIVERERKLISRYRKNDVTMTAAEIQEAENILEYRRRRKLKRKMNEEAVPA